MFELLASFECFIEGYDKIILNNYKICHRNSYPIMKMTITSKNSGEFLGKLLSKYNLWLWIMWMMLANPLAYSTHCTTQYLTKAKYRTEQHTPLCQTPNVHTTLEHHIFILIKSFSKKTAIMVFRIQPNNLNSAYPRIY